LPVVARQESPETEIRIHCGGANPIDVIAQYPHPMMMKFFKEASRNVHATQCLSLWMGLVMIFDACGVLRLDEMKSP
jgi:hypothetical protein